MFQSGVNLPLGSVVAEVGHQAEAEGVRALPTLHDAQVAGGLGQTLPETQGAVILGKSVSLKEPWWQQQQKTRKVRPSTLWVRSKFAACG